MLDNFKVELEWGRRSTVGRVGRGERSMEQVERGDGRWGRGIVAAE